MNSSWGATGMIEYIGESYGLKLFNVWGHPEIPEGSTVSHKTLKIDGNFKVGQKIKLDNSMKIIKSDSFQIDELFNFEGVDYHVRGDLTLTLIDDSDYSHTGYGHLQYVEEEADLTIQPHNQEALETFVREKTFDY